MGKRSAFLDLREVRDCETLASLVGPSSSSGGPRCDLSSQAYRPGSLAERGFGPEALPPNLTLALGTGQVTPLEMARAFAVFANGGFRVTPYLIERVNDAGGRAVFTAQPAVACVDCPGTTAAPAAITPANAFVMTDIMSDVIQRGTAQRARSLGRSDLAGKTGTTNDRRDAWFVGFNADLVAAAWVGFDQQRSLGDDEEGGRTSGRPAGNPSPAG